MADTQSISLSDLGRRRHNNEDDAEDDGILLDRLQIELLADGLRHDAPAIGRNDQRIRKERAHLRTVAPGKAVEQLGEIRVAQGEGLTFKFIYELRLLSYYFFQSSISK